MTDRDDNFEVFVDPAGTAGEHFTDSSAGGAFEAVPTDIQTPTEGFSDPVSPIPADRFSDPAATSAQDEYLPLFMRTDRPAAPSPTPPLPRQPIVEQPVELPPVPIVPNVPVQPSGSTAPTEVNGTTPALPDEFSGQQPLPLSVDPGDRTKYSSPGIGLKGWGTAIVAGTNNVLEKYIPAFRNENVRKLTGTVLVAIAGAAALVGTILWIKNGSFVSGGGGNTDPAQAGAGSGTSSSATTPPSSPSAEVAPPASSSSQAVETTTTAPQPSTTGSSQPPETTTTATTTTESTTTTTNPTTTTEVTTTTTQSPSTTSSPSSPNTSGSIPADPADPGNPGTGPDAGPADPNANDQPTVNSRTVQPGDNIYKIGAREEGLDGSQITEGLRDGSIKAYDHNGNLVADPGKIQPGYTVEFTTPATTPPLPEVAPADAVVLGDGGTLSDSAPHMLEGAGKPVTGENIHNATEAIMIYNQETYGIDLTWESAHNIHGTTLADGTSVATLRGQVIHMPPIGMLDELMARAEELSPTN